MSRGILIREGPAPLEPDAHRPANVHYEPLTAPAGGQLPMAPAFTPATRRSRLTRPHSLMIVLLLAFALVVGLGLRGGGQDPSPGAVVMPKPSVTLVPARSVRGAPSSAPQAIRGGARHGSSR